MKPYFRLSILFLIFLGWTAGAQTSREELLTHIELTAGNYANYPVPTGHLTPAPEGYEPFYISHYGRHGARYMTSDRAYRRLQKQLDTAQFLGILTDYGKDVYLRVQKAAADAKDRAGELTALGGRQHQEIARRMYERFPELLSRPLQVDARSSTVGRCMISMFYFCQELQGLNPTLDIRMDASQRDMPFIVRDPQVEPVPTPASAGLEQQAESLYEKAANPARLMKTLFTDTSKAESVIDGHELMECLFNVASDLQNVPELNLSLTDVFTKDEWFRAWKAINAGILLSCGLIPGSTPMYQRQTTVRDSIVRIADQVIRSGEPSLTLRFAHDGSLLPLAYLMGIREAMGGRTDFKNLHKSISVDKLIPMAANLQLVFYRKEGSDDILVKFLLNENETSIPVKTDVAPYYHWQDVKRYWAGDC